MMMMNQEANGKVLNSLKNMSAERYWDMRWKREWQTKYHDPLMVSYTIVFSEDCQSYCARVARGRYGQSLTP